MHQPSPAQAREPDGEHADLGVVMANLARTLQEGHSSHPDSIQAVLQAAVLEIANVDSAGIILQEKGQLLSTAKTDSLSGALDHQQIAGESGPSVTALADVRTVRIDDMQSDDRWPAFAKEATRLGVRSMLVLELFVQERVLGALNLYSMTPKAFDESSESLGIMFAAHAAIALAGARQEQNLELALQSRDLIGQAKGILMERYRLTADAAFALMVTSSQTTHLKLREVALRISTSGEVPTRTPRPTD